MADSKSYFVHYDIIVNTEKAVKAFEELSMLATNLQKPMNEVASTCRSISSALTLLEKNAKIEFLPHINTTGFSSQLKAMVAEVKVAAEEMQAALYQGLTASGKAAASQAGQNAAKQSSSVIKGMLAREQKAIEELVGPKGAASAGAVRRVKYSAGSKLDQAVKEAKGDNAGVNAVLRELSSRRSIASYLETQLKAAEEAEAKQAVAAAKAKPKPKAAPAGAPASAQEIGQAVTAVERQLAALKDRVLNIPVKIMAADLQEQLNALPRPVLTVGVRLDASSISRQIEALAGGRASGKAGATRPPAPWLKADEEELGRAGKAFETAHARFLKAQEAREKAAEALRKSPGNKAKAARAAAAEKAFGDAGRIAEEARKGYAALAGRKFQSTSDRILSQEEIAEGLRLQSVVGALKGKTSLTAAEQTQLAQAEAKLAALRAPAAPVKGQPAKVEAVAEVVGAKAAAEITIPVVAEVVSAVNKAGEIAVPVVGELVKVVQGSVGEVAVPVVGELTKIVAKLAEEFAVPVVGELTKIVVKLAEELTVPVVGELVKISVNLPAEIVVPVVGEMTGVTGAQKAAPAAVPPGAPAASAPMVAPAPGEGEMAKNNMGRGAASSHWVNLSRSLTAKGLNEITGLAGSDAEAKAVLANRKYFRAAAQALGISPGLGMTSEQWYSYLREVESRMKAAGAHVPAALYKRMDAYGRAAAAETLRASKAAADAQAKADAQAAASAKAAKTAADRNAMLPLANNESQLKFLGQHRAMVENAARALGIPIDSSISAQQRLDLLRDVKRQLIAANEAVPMHLEKEIRKLAEAQSKPSKSPAAAPAARRAAPSGPAAYPPPRTPYDGLRRWAFPFTGPSSFGVRTPMAVEMAKGMGVMFAIGGAMSAIGSSFGQAVEYQNVMRTAKAILQNGTGTYTAPAFGQMERIVRNVGVKTKFSAPEVASAAKFLAMAGFDIGEINSSIRPIADLALIGDTDLGETADKMTNIMTTFDIPAAKMRSAANIMVTTATRSNTDLMMLAESAKYGGGVAKMYGGDDPNVFADTMAIFGVMGNAGIQGSSAGTALRMMYQNLFAPNKKQAKVLQELEDKYGISTTNSDKTYRPMSVVLMDMANKIPRGEMAGVISKLFRITAQPGANAAITAAANANAERLVEEAEAEGFNAAETAAQMERTADLLEKGGLGKLAQLLEANRRAPGTRISEDIAEEKQNTIHGLWAQVTSTFTEGIVKAFEGKEGYLSGMLKKIRDFMASPETVRTLQNLMDLIIGLAEVLGKFAAAWAEIYSMMPGVIKFWVTTQLFFSQFGTLLMPVVALTGAFQRLGGVMLALAGGSAVSGGASAASAALRTGAGGAAFGTATNAALLAGMALPGKKGPGGRAGNALSQTMLPLRKAGATPFAAQLPAMEARLAKGMDPVPGLGAQFVKTPGPKYTPTFSPSKREGGGPKGPKAANFATPNLPSRKSAAMRTNFKGGWQAAQRALSFASAGATATWLASAAKGLVGSAASMLGSLFGAIISPIGLTVIAAGALAFSFYKLKQAADGNTEAQRAAAMRAAEAAEAQSEAVRRSSERLNALADSLNPKPQTVLSTEGSREVQEFDERQRAFREKWQGVLNPLDKDSSWQAIYKSVSEWRGMIESDPVARAALGVDRGNWDDMSWVYDRRMAEAYAAGQKGFWLHTRVAREVQQRQAAQALALEGAQADATYEAAKEITEGYDKVLKGELSREDWAGQASRTLAAFDPNKRQGLLASDGLTPETLGKTTNPAKYRDYWAGAYNYLRDLINGAPGTYVGKLDARSDLKYFTELGLAGTPAWKEAFGDAVAGLDVFFDLMDEEGRFLGQAKVKMQAFENGHANYDDILRQLQQVKEGFQLSLQGFLDMMATVYKMMGDEGLVPKNEDSMRRFLFEQASAADNGKIDEHTAKAFFVQNRMKQKGWKDVDLEDYLAWVTNQDGVDDERDYLSVAGQTHRNVVERCNIRLWAARRTAEAYSPWFGKDLPGSPEADGGKGSEQKPPAGDQTAYNSAYDRDAARPTQVVINIENLANFDRTTVASSAEERDLLSAMEGRIAEAVYRLFSEAANSSNYALQA